MAGDAKLTAVVFSAADSHHDGAKEGREGDPRAIAVAVRVPDVHLTREVEGEEAETGKRERAVAAGEGLL
jgi:hypothetical protein